MKPTTSKKSIILAALLMASVMSNGCSKPAPAQEQPQNMTPEVSFIVLKPEPAILSTQLPARVSALRTAEIRPRVSGLLQKRFFVEGTDVQADQVLYQIDPEPFQVEYDNAVARLDVARKTADRARAALDVSKSNITQQQANLDFAQKNRKRMEELSVDGAVSATERDQAVTEGEVCQAALKSAEAKVQYDREAITEAEAAIKQAQAGVEAARINLGYTQVIAPITGRIGRSSITEGAIVTAYQPLPLSTIQQLDPIYVDVPRSTAELLRLQQLQRENQNQEGVDFNKVKILLEDDTEYPLPGDLQFREVTVDPSTGSVILRIVVPNPDGILLPSMFVKAVVTEGYNEQALLVPHQAVTRDPSGNSHVLTVDSDNTVQQKALTIDRSIGNRWLVTSGLVEGDRIIVEGILKVRPGMTVNPIPFETGAQSTEPNSEVK